MKYLWVTQPIKETKTFYKMGPVYRRNPELFNFAKWMGIAGQG